MVRQGLTPINKYLNKHALNSPWRIEGNDRCNFAAAVVIPALAEGDSLWATLASLAANPADCLARTLVLVVVNQRVDADEADRLANLADLLRLQRDGKNLHPLQLAWVDAATPDLELPAKGGGVGLARRIGFDLALNRLDLNRPSPFLVALDADTLVGPDYLPALFRHFQTASAGGAVLPFAHQDGAGAAGQAAIERYELFLRHYVLGLSLAGSPYAFHSVGSALACRAEAYARAGGMNKRPAGEDFYFLQQLAKTSGVAQVRGTLVRPSPRPSARTPFGTGRSVARLLAGEEDAVSFYHPDCFRILGRWLQLAAGRLLLDGEQLIREAAAICPDLAGHLREIGFAAVWARLRRNHPTPEALGKAFHDWFDGLASLRLIHHLGSGPRARCRPEDSLPQLLQWAKLEDAGHVSGWLRTLRSHQRGGI
ncbi:glycosyltransferase [Trichloromonas sp.]|uniref:glycosyltransferase n=1 Tax=Trichloromonas sp. TaxID=3069249 RepID=UPI003D8195A4